MSAFALTGSSEAGSGEVDGSDYAPEAAPRERPLTYPGRWPITSYLLTENAEWEICHRDDRASGNQADEPDAIRLGHCRVVIPVVDRELLRLSTAVDPFLSDVLERLNVVPIDARVPVLAVGSNASPAQMRHKFRERGVSEVIPMMRAQIRGIRAGFAPVIAPAGYVPATVVPDPGASTTLFIQWLDEFQLQVIDDSEIGYKRVFLAADSDSDTGHPGAGHADSAHPIDARLETGERLGGWYAYIFAGGHLTDSNGPILMGNPLQPLEAAAHPHRTTIDRQRDLLDALIRSSSEIGALMGPTAESWIGRTSSTHRTRVVSILDADGRIDGRDFVDAAVEAKGRSHRRYGEILPILPALTGEASGAVAAVASASRRDLARNGQSCVRITPDLHASLGFPQHVSVRSRSLLRTRGESAPSAIAAVVADLLHSKGGAGAPIAEVDHVLRMAVGLEIGEVAVIVSVQVRRRTWSDLLIGKPNYETMRVTLADPSTAERDVCLISALSLQLLGVESGDHIVIEGTPGEAGAIPSTTLKAFELPAEILAERSAVTAGTWGARFPSPRDTLGTQPDIAVIFLDGASRSRLGLTSQQMATVRVRPARGHQFRRELREMMLVLAIALIGVAGLVENSLWAFVLILGFVSGTVLLVVLRMKRRLSHSLIVDTGIRSKKGRLRRSDR